MGMLILSLCAGLLVGVFIKMPKNFEKYLSGAQKYVVYLLILLLGGAIGGDEDLIDQLPMMGFKSFIIAAFAVIGSVLCCLLFLRLLGMRRKKHE